MKKDINRHIKNEGTYILAFIKWMALAAIIGAIGGMLGAAFHLSVEMATEFRAERSWMIWLLPIGGLIVVFLYRISDVEGAGTNAILGSIHFGSQVPWLLVPVIFISTVITHLCGGSAGREGAALQIGGGVGCNVGRALGLGEKDEPLATLCGMSAVFSALFGTPITATVFALEVCSVGLIHYSGLVPCVTAALVAFGITQSMAIPPENFAVIAPQLDMGIMFRVVLLAAICAFVSIAFCELMHYSEHRAERWLPNPYVRVLVGSAVLIALTYAVGSNDYNGAGMHIIEHAIEEGQTKPFAFLLKIIFTAVTLSCGFKGGEVVPTFFIGATLGCALSSIVGLPAGFAAAIGLAAMFCGAVNCPLATVLLSIELFGSQGFIYFAVACFVSYMLSGYSSLYVEQKIMYSKLRAEYINIHAN